MGIAGLLKNLHPLLVAPPTHPSNQQQNNNGGSNNNKIKVRHNIRQFANKSIAIDASGWLHKAAYTCAERLVESTENGTRDSVAEQKYTKYMIDRCSELLQFAQIDKIYLVFDGLRVPLKSGTNASRESKRQANLKEARRLMACGRRSEAHEKYRMCAKGSEIMARVVAAKVQERWGKDDTGTNDNVRVKCVWSPYEADSQLAKLCVDGWCHAVVTEDSDVLVYSAVTRKPFPIIYKLDRKDGSCDVISMDWLLNPTFLASLNGSNKSKSKKKKSRRRRKRDLEQDLDYIYNNSPQDDENEDNEGDDDISDSKAQVDEPEEVHPCEIEYDDQGMAPVRRALPPPSASNNNNSKKKKSSGNDGNAKMLAYLRSFANKEVAKPGEGVRLFVQACVLSGCDYIVNRLSKVGPVTAFRLVKEASHRDAGIRFERVLKSLPSGSKLVAEASDKSSEDGDNEDAEYDDFLELPDTDRDSKEKYEELLSKSEAVFYYHLAKEISSNKVLPLVGHKSSSAIDVDDEEEEEDLDVDESFRPCLERFEGGLTFVGSADEALKKKHGPLPPANGRHYRQAVSNNNGWLQTKKKGSGPVQNNYQKPSTNNFFRKNSASATTAAPKQKVTATIATQPTGLNRYFGKPQQQKSTTTSSKKSSHFQKPAASANATATELKPNPYAKFSHGVAAEKTTSTKKKKKSPMPTLSDRATNKAMMKSPPNFSPVRFDYGGYTPQGNSQKKSIKSKSCVDINKTSDIADDNYEPQQETVKESGGDNRNDEQMKVPNAASNTTNDHAFDYGIQVPESPPVKEQLEPGTGSLSRYINETKSFDKPRRVSTSPEKIKQKQSNNSEDVIELLGDDEDDDDLSTSAVNSDENQPNCSQTSKTAPIIKSSVNNRKFKSPYPTTTGTGQTSSTTRTTKKKATSSSALLAGFSRQRKAAAGSTRGTKRSRFFPISRTTESSQQKKSVKRPKGVPSLKNFMVNKE